MSYIVSLLTDEWRDGLLHECVPYRLMSDGAGSLQIARTSLEGVENVGVELQVHMIKYGGQVSSLLSHEDTPFFIMAICKRDPLAPPVALDLYVNAPLFDRDMLRIGTVAGEKAVVDMLTVAGRHNLLFKRFDAPVATSERPVNKRARTAPPEPCQSTADLLHRLVTREHSNTHVGMPLFLNIPGSQFVFCLNEYAFVPQAYGSYETLQLNAGAVVGDRGADKTELVKQLIVTTRAESIGSRRNTPPFLRAVKATLLVVPTALVEQWHAALAPTCRVIVVLNKRMLHQLATFGNVVTCDVVIVTHMFYASVLRKTSSKHKSRVCARAPLSEISHQYCRLDWVFWKRVVFDEALQFYTCGRKAWNSVARGRALWLLQGGSELTSLDACALLDFMMQHTHISRPCPLNVSVLGLDCFFRATAAHQKNQLHVDTISTTLTETEARAYNILQRACSSTEELVQVAAGDLSPVKKFMHPVPSWAHAVPLGSKILSGYIDSVSDVGFVWEVDDNDDDDGDEPEPVAAAPVDAVEVQVDASDSVSAVEEADGQEEEEGVGPLRQQLDEMLDDIVDETTDEMQERLEFFKRAGTDLDKGDMEAACCSVCLTNTCDCLFVCGHMLCHECVVHLFLSSKKREVEELERQGIMASNEGFIAQCPQCRWELEPHEVFWMTGGSSKNHKHVVLSDLLRQLLGERQSVLVVGTMPEVVLSLMQSMCDEDLPCKALTYSPVTCRQALTWFKANPGRVLFLYTDQLNGLKLPFVRHVVLLHPHVHGLVQQHVVQSAVMHCVNDGNAEHQVHVHRLLAANTVEEATGC